jgi:membrane protein implicated in regulation of membrane protease activity
MRDGWYAFVDKRVWRKESYVHLIGKTAQVRDRNMVFVNGALWKFECNEDVEFGEKVEIIEIDGLKLKVGKLD